MKGIWQGLRTNKPMTSALTVAFGAAILTLFVVAGENFFRRRDDCPRWLTRTSAGVAFLALSPGARFGAVSWYYAGDLLQLQNYRTSVYDLETGAELASIGGYAMDMSWVDDERIRYIKLDMRPVDVRQNEIREWNFVTGDDKLILLCPNCRGFAVSADGRYAFTVGFRLEGSVLEIRESIDAAPLVSISQAGWYPRWSPDGTKVATEGLGGLLTYEVATGSAAVLEGEFTPPFQGKPLWLSNHEILVGDGLESAPPFVLDINDPGKAVRVFPTGRILGSRYKSILNLEVSRDGKRFLMGMEGGDIVTADERCLAEK